MQQRSILRRNSLWLSIFFVFTLLACRDVCKDVAYKMCECKKTSAEVLLCKREMDLRDSDPRLSGVSKSDPAICQQALKECSCDDLDSNNLEICKLTRK